MNKLLIFFFLLTMLRSGPPGGVQYGPMMPPPGPPYGPMPPPGPGGQPVYPTQMPYAMAQPPTDANPDSGRIFALATAPMIDQV